MRKNKKDFYLKVNLVNKYKQQESLVTSIENIKEKCLKQLCLKCLEEEPDLENSLNGII
jgi:hypothetical protein